MGLRLHASAAQSSGLSVLAVLWWRWKNSLDFLVRLGRLLVFSDFTAAVPLSQLALPASFAGLAFLFLSYLLTKLSTLAWCRRLHKDILNRLAKFAPWAGSLAGVKKFSRLSANPP